jgi:hypothetical protein
MRAVGLAAFHASLLIVLIIALSIAAGVLFS